MNESNSAELDASFVRYIARINTSVQEKFFYTGSYGVAPICLASILSVEPESAVARYDRQILLGGMQNVSGWFSCKVSGCSARSQPASPRNQNAIELPWGRFTNPLNQCANKDFCRVDEEENYQLTLAVDGEKEALSVFSETQRRCAKVAGKTATGSASCLRPGCFVWMGVNEDGNFGQDGTCGK